MAEPELYRHKDTGEKIGGFVLSEGVVTGLPIAPEDMFVFGKDGGEDEELSEWRLFLHDGEGNECVLEYHRAIRALQFLAEYGEKYLIGEKDGYVVTTPLTRGELRTLANAVSLAESGGGEDSAGDSDEDEDSGEEDNETGETVYLNPDDPDAPYLTRLSSRRHLFVPGLLMMAFLNASGYISGRINMSAGDQLALFLSSLALAAALCAGSYAVGYVLLGLVTRLFRNARHLHNFLRLIAILCIIDILGRMALILILRGREAYAVNWSVCSFGTLFAVFDVWAIRSGGAESKPGKFRRILGAGLAAMLWTCWHFLGFKAGSLMAFAVAAVVLIAIFTVNSAAGIAQDLKQPLARLIGKCGALLDSWKARILLAALTLLFGASVCRFGFKAGAIIWAVAAAVLSVLVLALRSVFGAVFGLVGGVFGKKLAQDGISFDDEGNVVVEEYEAESRDFLYSGSDDADRVAWHLGNSGRKTHEVMQKEPNALGLYDMSGNVTEWCWDTYGAYGATTAESADVSGCRVGRGGNWFNSAKCCRVAFRYPIAPKSKSDFLGFRLARNAADEPPASGDFVLVAGGEFLMGSALGTGESDEHPQHEEIVGSFRLCAHQVTQEEYERTMGKNPSQFRRGGDFPVETVSWFDAVRYCNTRSRDEGLSPCYYYLDGGGRVYPHGAEQIPENAEIRCDWNADGYRLPTEAEWEYAARGGNKSNSAQGGGEADSEETSVYDPSEITLGDEGEQLPDILRFGAAKTPVGIYSLSSSRTAVIPLDPKPMFQARHSDGTIRPVHFWRLFLYGAEGEKLGDIEYYRAVFWLKTIIDDAEVRTLGDGCEYLVFEHGLLESELKTLIDFAKDDAETDDAGYTPPESAPSAAQAKPAEKRKPSARKIIIGVLLAVFAALLIAGWHFLGFAGGTTAAVIIELFIVAIVGLAAETASGIKKLLGRE